MFFELDVFWTQQGGADPAKLLEKYRSRFKLMHVKDLKKGAPKNLTGGAPDEESVPVATDCAGATVLRGGRSSLLGLPQLDAIAFGIGNQREATVVVVLYLFDLQAGSAELLQRLAVQQLAVSAGVCVGNLFSFSLKSACEITLARYYPSQGARGGKFKQHLQMPHRYPILLAEDNEDDIFLAKRAVKVAEILNPLVVLRDGLAVMEHVNAFSCDTTSPLPLLLLLDIKMPHMTGFDVLRWIRGESPLKNLVVVMFSSSAQPSDLHRAYALGANSYLVKGGSWEQTIEQFSALHRYWSGWNRPPLVPPMSKGERLDS